MELTMLPQLKFVERDQRIKEMMLMEFHSATLHVDSNQLVLNPLVVNQIGSPKLKDNIVSTYKLFQRAIINLFYIVHKKTIK